LIAAPPAWKFATICAVTLHGKGADAARGHAVVAGEHRRPHPIERRPFAPLPARHEQRDLLQPPQRSRRLGQHRLPRARRGQRGIVGLRQGVERGAERRRILEADHGQTIMGRHGLQAACA
jgi:hypothetical protein